MRPPQTSVVIIGAGPTGLTLALLLSRAGVPSTLVERESGPREHPAACILSTRTMEVFRELGLAERILKRCQNVFSRSDVRWVTALGGRELGRLAALPCDRSSLPASPVHITHFSQNRLEPLLWERARQDPLVWFLPSTRCLSVCEVGESVEAVLEGPPGTPRCLTGELLVACDGAHGSIRRQLGIQAPGRVLAHMLGVHFTADLGHLVQDRPSILYWVLNPRLLGVLIGHWLPREWVLYTPYFPPFQSTSGVDEERCRELVATAVGAVPADLRLGDAVPWVLGARLADAYRRGRVFLAGDAAHSFPPTGGLGLNTGVQDAHNLAWKVAAWLRGAAGDALLDSYERERRPVARTNLEHSVSNYENMAELLRVVGIESFDQSTIERIATAPVVPARWRGRLFEIVLRRTLARLSRFDREGLRGDRARRELQRRIPAQAPHYRFTGLDLGVVYHDGAVVGALEPMGVRSPDPIGQYEPSTLPGARLPHLWVEHRGSRLALHDVLSPSDLVLLTDEMHAAVWSAAVRMARPLMPIRCLGIGSGPDADLVDAERVWPSLSGLEAGGAVLVRPDGHIAWRIRLRPANPTVALGVALDRVLDARHAG